MEKTLKQKLKESILTDTFYDFMTNNYFLFTKEELVTLLKNFYYTCYQLEKESIYFYDFMNVFLENLNDYEFFNENE